MCPNEDVCLCSDCVSDRFTGAFCVVIFGLGQFPGCAGCTAVSGLRNRIELQASKALIHEAGGLFSERFRALSPVADGFRPGGHVHGVIYVGVRADPVAISATEQAVDGDAVMLADNVPQGRIKRTDHTKPRVIGMLMSEPSDHAMVQRFRLQWVLAFKISGEGFLNHELVAAGQSAKRVEHGSFSPAHQSGIGFKLHEKPGASAPLRRRRPDYIRRDFGQFRSRVDTGAGAPGLRECTRSRNRHSQTGGLNEMSAVLIQEACSSGACCSC